eukprot:236868-Hanusia_phi.AAC.3
MAAGPRACPRGQGDQSSSPALSLLRHLQQPHRPHPSEDAGPAAACRSDSNGRRLSTCVRGG